MFPESSEPPPPPVWKWYVAYCVAMAALYLFVFGFGFYLFFSDPVHLQMDPVEAQIVSIATIVIGLVFLIAFASGPLLPQQKWAWVVGIVLIAIGLTSLCCLPAAIPLLISWLKPETKAFYNAGKA